MLVAFTFAAHDWELALKNLRWDEELKVGNNHDILLVCPSGVSKEVAQQALEIAQRAYRKATLYHLIDDCTLQWPFGANFMWKRTVDYIDHFGLYPFMFKESDAWFLTPGALDLLQQEWKKAEANGKHFVGYLEYAGSDKIAHMNGVGIYGDIFKYAPSAMSAPIPQSQDQIGDNHMAFDMAGATEIVPQMVNSSLFQFQYKNEAKLLKDTSLSWLNPDAVVFHTDKTAGLIELLRARRNGTPAKDITGSILREDISKVVPSKRHPSDEAPSFDIFIKTWKGDAIWHEHCLRSIDKYCTGFRNVVQNHEEHERGYLYQQVVKLNADRYTDADYILHTDSDTLFTVPVKPQAFIHNGKTDWHYEPFASALQKEGDGALAWKRAMEKFIGEEPQHEFMRRHPEMIPRWLYQAFRTFCWEKHGCSVEQYVMSQKEFSEWNVLGFYAWTYHRESFNWINDSQDDYVKVVHQFWTGPHNQTLDQRHERAKQAIPEMQAILAGTSPQNPPILTVPMAQEKKEPAPKKRQASPKMLAALERAREEKRKKQLAKA